MPDSVCGNGDNVKALFRLFNAGYEGLQRIFDTALTHHVHVALHVFGTRQLFAEGGKTEAVMDALLEHSAEKIADKLGNDWGNRNKIENVLSNVYDHLVIEGFEKPQYAGLSTALSVAFVKAGIPDLSSREKLGKLVDDNNDVGHLGLVVGKQMLVADDAITEM